jgi:hypothetical protein
METAMDNDRDGHCCICGEAYTSIGNSPWPISEHEDDRCCSDCNETWIIPARLYLLATECERNSEHEPV